MTRRLLVALAALSLLAGPAAGAIVVLKNGEVYVGKVRPEEDRGADLVLRWPYKQRTERGEMRIPRYRIRWYDPEGDELTQAYFEEFGDEPIAEEWQGAVERWRIRQEAISELGLVDPDSAFQLADAPVAGDGFRIRGPAGWEHEPGDAEGELVLAAPRTSLSEGWGPEVRVRVGAAEGTADALLDAALEAAAEGATDHQLQDRTSEDDGAVAEAVTSARVDEHRVMTLRRVIVRDGRAVWFTAGVDLAQWMGSLPLFRIVLTTLELDEDAEYDSQEEGEGE